MKLTEKSQIVFEYLKNNGGKVSIDELANATGRSARSVGANVLDLTKKGLVVREKEEVEGAEKPVAYAILTDAGKTFVPSDDAE
jgi:predicted transcriptional regulator|nr:MAG TPA: putative membrane-associated trancriptional regulator [Caudoviricetes sp.]